MNKFIRTGKRVGPARRALCAAAVLLILGTGIIALTAQRGGQEDPLSIIQRHGTAGMRLQGGKAIVVRDNKLYVRSGQAVRPLFADKAEIVTVKNDSKIGAADIKRLSLEALEAKLSGPLNQSYKVHASYTLKSQTADRKTVLCRFVFEYKNIWLAEEHSLEMDIASKGTAHTLTEARTVALAEAKPGPALKRRAAVSGVKAKASPEVKVRGAADFSVTKQTNYKIDTTLTAKIASRYQNFTAVPIHDFSRELGRAVVSFGPTAKGLANTAYPSVVTAEEATNQVHALMQGALGTAAKLVGPAQSTRDEILDYLKNDTNLVAWNNIGHGNTSTIFQNGTDIVAADFAVPANFQGLSGCVCLVNSCQTFNDPLKAAILACAPRTYIAGVINLPMVTSEGSNPNFWWKTLYEHKAMSVAYSETNTESGLNGYWGFWGDSGIF